MLIIQTHKEIYVSIRDEVPANNADLTRAGSESFKHKVSLRKTTAATNAAYSLKDI